MRHSVYLVVSDAAVGGVERVFSNLARGLSRQGIRAIVVLVGRRMTDNEWESVFEEAEVVDLRFGSDVHGLVLLARYARQVVGLASLLRQPCVGGIISAKEKANALTMVAAAYARSRAPRIVTRHVPLRVVVPGMRRDARWYTPRLYTLWSLMGARIVAVSREIAQDIEKVAVNGSDVRFLPNPVIPVANCQTRSVRDRTLVVAAGRLSHQKGFDILLRAVASEQFPKDARVSIFGEGELEGSLHSLADRLGVSDRVEFHGQVADVTAHIAGANVFVLSSRWEGMPTVLIEAASTGAAIVATDCPTGPKELLRNWEGAELVSVEAPEQLAAAVSRAIGRWGEHRPCALPSLSDYTIESAVDGYLRVMGIRPDTANQR